MASDEKLEKEFRRMDKNNDGSITIEELRKYYLPMQEMLGISPQLAEQEIMGLVKRLDVDGNGSISFEGKKTVLIFINDKIFFLLEFKSFMSRK
jgi:Ca2+-binding EF-hand superfamily protein